MSNPLLLPEIVASVIDNVYMVPDLLSCACVNHIWNEAALKKLYKGSLHDMRLRTPDIGSLNCLFVASPKRFARNMSFVKHLLLCPEQTPEKDPCYEKCRVLRHDKYAELLFQGRGLASLAIPFEIRGQDWPHNISDLLLTSTIEYLAINQEYCELLVDTPADKFSNLKALTVYISNNLVCNVPKLCKLLERCDLQFFHLEEDEWAHDDLLSQAGSARVLSCLHRHQNLQALALIVRDLAPPFESIREGQENPWPKLKALYLAMEDQHWLVPNSDELQILGLRDRKLDAPIFGENAIKNIAKCRHLRVIDLHSFELDNVEALLDIAHGCPLLQKFSMRRRDAEAERQEPDVGEDLLLNLVRALPQLEFLALDLKFQVDGARLLQHLARHCPRLTVLDLPETHVRLSLAVMRNIDSLWQLETLCFAKIYFEDPRRLLQSNNFEDLATEWRRIFPKVREGQFHLSTVYMYEFEEDSRGDLQGDHASASADGETSLGEPGLDSEDYESDSYILRRKLWRVLGYGRDSTMSSIMSSTTQYMWQTNFEIEAIGWPVVPLVAFCDPWRYCTCGWDV